MPGSGEEDIIAWGGVEVTIVSNIIHYCVDGRSKFLDEMPIKATKHCTGVKDIAIMKMVVIVATSAKVGIWVSQAVLADKTPASIV